MQEKKILVPSITCHHCVRTIKNELLELPGVEKVEGDPATKQVLVAWTGPATWEAIAETLEEIGYPAKV